MCNSMIKSGHGRGLAEVAQIDGRPVLQPKCNRVASLEAGRQLKKSFQKSLSLPTSITIATRSPSTNSDVEANDNSPVASNKATSSPRKPSSPVSPTSRPLKPVLKRANSLNLSTDKPLTPKSSATKSTPILVRKKSKKSGGGVSGAPVSLESSLDSKISLASFSFWSDRAPGSLAAAQREQASLMQAQRKMRIAHYGRTPAKLEGKVVPIDASINANATSQEEKRCSFITANSDPLYVAYHDEEWGVPVHDDRMLFELLVLTGAQVGLDWTTILKKRTEFREAFAGFDAEVVAGFTERRVASISAYYGMDLSRVRGTVDNANRILELRKEFGSLDKYLWGFMNHKPIATDYKSCRKIPVKTSKSESISKDLVRRGFRFVGPTVMHSFMQAAGLTNDHILACPRHSHCCALSSSSTTTTSH